MVESEGGFEDQLQPPQGRRKGKWIAIAAAVVALAVVGASIGVYTVLFANQPPVASFTSNSVDLRLLVNAESSTDPDGHVAQFNWDWGDGSTGTGVRAAHNYAEEKTYTVTLTVKDNRGGTNKSSQAVVIKVFPTALFTARQDRMNTSFDGSQSFVSTGEQITSYAWDFGDGSEGTGPRVNHTYATADKYRVVLLVTDTKNRKGDTSRFVSPANTTVDILVSDFFTAECPFSPYWLPRTGVYGDVLLRKQTACTDYYPWVLSSKSQDLQRKNPSWIYSTYRFNAKVRNHPGYTVDDPVILPVFNALVMPRPTSYIHYSMTFDYMNRSYIDSLKGTPWEVGTQFNDGYGYLFRGNITMDLTMSKRVFDIPTSANATEAQAWWYKNTIPGRNESATEKRLDGWMVRQGSTNGKYDIEAGYEWNVQTDIADLNATVTPDGTTTIHIYWTGWGLEALFQRWWYWGSANYTKAVNSPFGTVKPLGWMPMEVCWCERSTYNFTITKDLDLDYDTVSTYHFQAWGNWGPDGIAGTDDDLPAWVWAPYNMDYVPRAASGSPGEEGYPVSELRWLEGKQVLWGTPGSYAYGQPYEIINAPARWILNQGSTLTIILPKIDVPWYDPVKSKWTWSSGHKYGDYITFDSPMTLRMICNNVDNYSTCSSGSSGTYYTWDARGRTLSIAGPYDWGEKDPPLQPAPWIEFAPETSG